MAETLITSFFTKGGLPATTIETVTPGYPKVRIWEVIDGTAPGDNFVGEFQMIPMEDGVNDDGFYKYAFTTANGYDPRKKYVVRSDGGASLPANERYQTANIDVDVEYSVWDANRTSHLLPGTTGEGLSQIKADTTNIIDKLYLDSDSVLEVVQLLLKMEAGRTKIDAVNKTLTVYDEDCNTPLRTFLLLDSNGDPSISEVCERRPISKGVSDTTTITDVCL